MEIGVIRKDTAPELALWQQDYSADAERAVIGSMLIDASCVKDLMTSAMIFAQCIVEICGE